MGVNNWFHSVQQAAAQSEKATRAVLAGLVPGRCKPCADMA